MPEYNSAAEYKKRHPKADPMGPLILLLRQLGLPPKPLKEAVISLRNRAQKQIGRDLGHSLNGASK